MIPDIVRQIILFLCCVVALVQILYLWLLFRKLAFYRSGNKTKMQQHPVSVIICARDEAANLTRNLPGVLVQQYHSSHEIIVVNHNSQDETKYLLEEFHKQFKQLHIVNLSQEAMGIPGKKYPLSIGIKEARHGIVLLTDADCVPSSENWIELMQSAYDDNTDIVLGYGAYFKKKGILNKLIRFEAFHIALQYFSYALAGMPYMGVGRNLSYKKDLFLKNKGFSSLNHILSGDDDLFINKVATARNTAIVIDQNAITLSEPKKTFGAWMRQKRRHNSTSKYYKPRHKFLLGSYALSYFLFYPLVILTAIFASWQIALAVFVVRAISQAIIFYKTMKRLNEHDLFAWWWLLDIWMFFYYLIFAPTLWKKQRKTWL